MSLLTIKRYKMIKRYILLCIYSDRLFISCPDHLPGHRILHITYLIAQGHLTANFSLAAGNLTVLGAFAYKVTGDVNSFIAWPEAFVQGDFCQLSRLPEGEWSG